MPGIGEEMEGAVQQAPQWLRHCMLRSSRESRGDNSSPPPQLPRLPPPGLKFHSRHIASFHRRE